MNVDTSVVNTVLLVVIGAGGSVLIWRYIGPILSTQDKARKQQAEDMKALRIEFDAEKAARKAEREDAQRESEVLKEMVTQRARVDDLSQRVSIAVKDTMEDHRTLLAVSEDHMRKNAQEHNEQVLVLREIAMTLRLMHGNGGMSSGTTTRTPAQVVVETKKEPEGE